MEGYTLGITTSFIKKEKHEKLYTLIKKKKKKNEILSLLLIES
jgi:hypothetical protein